MTSYTLTPTVPPAPTDNDLQVISGGCTGLIKLRADGALIEKTPHANPDRLEESLQDLRREYAAYQRLPPHPRLLQLHPDSMTERLVLPYLRNGCLRKFLRAPSDSSVRSSASSYPVSRTLPLSQSQRLQFAADAAEALSILHNVNIIHADLNSWNFLIRDDHRLCIIDFAGSTIAGVAGSAFEGYRYRLPRSFGEPSTVRMDLFALGSVLYEIAKGKPPYEKCEDQEVVELFEKGVFPPTRNVLLGSVVRGCWQGAYESAEAVHEDVVQEQCRVGKVRNKALPRILASHEFLVAANVGAVVRRRRSERRIGSISIHNRPSGRATMRAREPRASVIMAKISRERG